MASRHLLGLAGLALALGAVGPWAHGTFVEQPIFGEERASARTVAGADAGGLLLAGLALAVALVAWVAPWTLPARVFIFAALGACAVGLGLALANGGLSMAPVYFHVFAEWRDVRLGWGLVLACAAWLAATAAALARATPASDAQAPAG